MIELDLIVEEDAWSEIPGLESVCQTAFDAAAKVQPAKGNVALLLTDNEALRALNHQFRNKDKPTDVLSFPADPMDRPMLGDIAVALGVARDDAEAQNKMLSDHLTHLLIHGYLHLLGHDHETDHEAEMMEGLEIKALASLGIDNPYLSD